MYIIQLPLKNNAVYLRLSYEIAKRQLFSVERSLSNYAKLKMSYMQFMVEYIKLALLKYVIKITQVVRAVIYRTTQLYMKIVVHQNYVSFSTHLAKLSPD